MQPDPDLAVTSVAKSTAVAADYDPAVEDSAAGKAARRLLPLLCLGFLLSYLDRTNIAVAALTMNKELGIGPELFGVVSGVFFAGYVVCEVPSNLIMRRVGVRRWLARIMFTWGAVTVVTAFVTSSTALLWCRVALGVAEAGFTPAVVVYLTVWFGRRHQSRMLGWFYVAIPLAFVVGAPLGGLLVGFDDLLGLSGWRWLFLIDGAATLVLAVVYLCRLPDGPADARWLDDTERAALTARLAAEGGAIRHRGVADGLRHPKLLGLCAVGVAFGFAIFGVGFWLPQLIRASLGVSGSMQISLLTAFPYLLTGVLTVLWSRRADRHGTRSFHTALPMVVGGVALAVSSLAVSLPWLGYAGICLSVVGTLASAPSYFTMPSMFLTGAAAAAGVAFMNTWANVASFLGPYLVGWVTATTGRPTIALVAIGVVLALGGALAGALRLRDRPVAGFILTAADTMADQEPA